MMKQVSMRRIMMSLCGTIITAFFMGPLIELFNARAARPLLAGHT